MPIVDLTARLGELLAVAADMRSQMEYQAPDPLWAALDDLFPELLAELLTLRVIPQYAWCEEQHCLINLETDFRPAVPLIYPVVYFQHPGEVPESG